LFNRRTGVIAASMLAIHSFHIFWSQQARSYALLTLLLVVSTSLLVSALRAPQLRRTWAAYVVVSALACYCQVFAVRVLITQWLWPTSTEGLGDLRLAFGALLALAILIAPAGLYVIYQNNGQEDWVQPFTGSRFMHAVLLLSGGTEFAGRMGEALLWLV